MKTNINNKKGFTLVELLAVIVILGLLMAIAIPSVSRYINESRKNTMAVTINNYIGILVTDMNNLEYPFAKNNTVYAVPIECIPVERGGKNPFGSWHQANDSYWAYVLVQYDVENSSYNYGFTFKDSAGYGLYPTAQNSLNDVDKDIRTGLALTRPKTGKITKLTPVANWAKSGLKVDESTNLVVLVSESEGKIGNGTTTCTLAQKGDNYDQVEDEKEKNELLKKVYALVLDNSSDAVDTTPMIFVRSLDEIEVNDTYTSETYGDRKVIAVYKDFERETYTTDGSTSNAPWASQAANVTSVTVEHQVQPLSTAGWFVQFYKTSRFDLAKLDVSKVEDMSYMFYNSGGDPNIKTYEIIGLHTWNTSNVKNMTGTFAGTGGCAADWIIGDISGWDTSNVTAMQGMFASAGYQASNWSVNFSGWDVTSVTDMSYMFAHAVRTGTSFNIIGLDSWDTSNVKTMTQMFYYAGGNANYKLDVSMWDVSSVTSYTNFSYRATNKVIAPAKFK